MKRILLRLSYVVCALGLAFCCLAALKPELFQKETVEAQPAAAVADSGDALSQFILEREQLRSMQIASLDEIINSDKSSQELIDSAQKEKIEIVRRMEVEQTVAGILRARGYTDAAVAAGDEYVSVMIRALQADDVDVARITELVLSQSDLEAEDIKIIPIN